MMTPATLQALRRLLFFSIEEAALLIGAGFMVRINDEAAHAKAIAGDFAPEQRRWCSKLCNRWRIEQWTFCSL